jgi:HK97 family phage major capsid protein
MVIEPLTVSFTPIAALASFSRQILDDFADFYSSVPREIYRAVVDAETDQIVNGNGTEPNMLGGCRTPAGRSRVRLALTRRSMLWPRLSTICVSEVPTR